MLKLQGCVDKTSHYWKGLHRSNTNSFGSQNFEHPRRDQRLCTISAYSGHTLDAQTDLDILSRDASTDRHMTRTLIWAHCLCRALPTFLLIKVGREPPVVRRDTRSEYRPARNAASD